MTVGRSAELEELFQPSSIAVIGASNRPNRVGTALFRNILEAGYRGVVYPVNPSWKSVSGVRCYPDVAHLPEAPELGIVIVPAAGVVEEVDRLAKMGTRGVVVISAGFREVGDGGAQLEAEVVRHTEKHRMSLVGPNCFGLLNTDPEVSLNATFSDTLPPRGNIAFVSQSGALCAGILSYATAERIGFSRFVSVGNRAGVDETDLLFSLGKDPATKVILLYMESLVSGRKFLEVAREVTETKPVLIIKSGRTPAGERAAKSHTGSLALSGRDQLYDSVFEQAGVLRAETIGELFRMAKFFSSGMRLDGPRLAILTNSGGPGIVAADAAVRNGLELPIPSAMMRETLRARLPSIATVLNPVDMTAEVGPAQYREALKTLLDSPEYHGALVITTPARQLTAEAVAQAILDVKMTTKKPVAACIFGLSDLSREVTFLEEHGVPTYTFPEEAVQGLGALVRYHTWWTRPRTEVRAFPVDRAAARRAIARAQANNTLLLSQGNARALLEPYGISFPRARSVRTATEAVAAAEQIGYPVVLKVVSSEILHKTEAGGVALGINDAEELRGAWDRMQESLKERAPGVRIEGFDVESEISGGKEVLIGIQRDPSFGPIVVFGMGGIYVEVLRDITFRLAPIRALSAEHMVESVRGFPVLKGVRGEGPSDLAALTEAIQRVSQLAVDLPEVLELDLNPILVRAPGKGVVAVDARVVLAPPSKSAPSPSAHRSGTALPRTPPHGGGTRRRR